MKITFLNSYRKSGGNIVHRYAVTGTPAELERYEQVQGDYYTTDENTGKPLFFTNNATLGKVAELQFSNDGTRVYAVNPQATMLESLANQFGTGSFGDAIRQQAAQAMIQQVLGMQTVVAQQQIVSSPVAAIPVVEDDAAPFTE